MATASEPFSLAETASVLALADKLAKDEKFGHTVGSFKPGDEAKLERALADAGFKGFKPSIELKPQALKPQTTYRICLCSTIISGLCICIQYTTK
jgi:hypothetical protein